MPSHWLYFYYFWWHARTQTEWPNCVYVCVNRVLLVNGNGNFVIAQPTFLLMFRYKRALWKLYIFLCDGHKLFKFTFESNFWIHVIVLPSRSMTFPQCLDSSEQIFRCVWLLEYGKFHSQKHHCPNVEIPSPSIFRVYLAFEKNSLKSPGFVLLQASIDRYKWRTARYTFMNSILAATLSACANSIRTYLRDVLPLYTTANRTIRKWNHNYVLFALLALVHMAHHRHRWLLCPVRRNSSERNLCISDSPRDFICFANSKITRFINYVIIRIRTLAFNRDQFPNLFACVRLCVNGFPLPLSCRPSSISDVISFIAVAA